MNEKAPPPLLADRVQLLAGGGSWMRRIGLALMATLLAVPMLRQCCLPTATIPHCHQSKDSDKGPCYQNPVAIAEKKTAVGFPAVDFGPTEGVVRSSLQLKPAATAGDQLTLILPDTSTELYLRVGVLLI